MNSKVVFMFNFLLLFCSQLFSMSGAKQEMEDYAFERATLSDIPQLLHHYSKIAESVLDSNKLVVLPEAFLVKRLQDEVLSKKFFVARSSLSESNQIICFLKLYPFEEIGEIDKILRSEIKCLGAYESVSSTVKKGKYIFPLLDTDDDPFKEFQDCRQMPSQSYCCHSAQGYLYLGGIYTDPAFRGKKICVALLQHAFSVVRKEIAPKFRQAFGVPPSPLNASQENLHTASTKPVSNRSVPSPEVILVYGQVKANTGMKFMVREFARFIHLLMRGNFSRQQTPIELDYYMFESLLPKFINSDERLVENSEVKVSGQGVVLRYYCKK